jgi:hypothetical protein
MMGTKCRSSRVRRMSTYSRGVPRLQKIPSGIIRNEYGEDNGDHSRVIGTLGEFVKPKDEEIISHDSLIKNGVSDVNSVTSRRSVEISQMQDDEQPSTEKVVAHAALSSSNVTLSAEPPTTIQVPTVAGLNREQSTEPKESLTWTVATVDSTTAIKHAHRSQSSSAQKELERSST